MVEEIDSDKSNQKKGAAMAEVLKQLAERGTFRGVDDPKEWQREMRRERVLSGRRK